MILVMTLAIWSAAQAPSPAPVKPPVIDQIACGPLGLTAPPAAGLRLLGGYVHGRLMFAPGDAVVVNAGTSQGIQPGQQYFVRRLINDSLQKQPKVGAFYGVHTAGWVTVVDAKDSMAIAKVTHACDEILEGDFLEAYAEPVVPPPAETGTPDYQNPGRLVMGDERRQTGSAGVLMVINRAGRESRPAPDHLPGNARRDGADPRPRPRHRVDGRPADVARPDRFVAGSAVCRRPRRHPSQHAVVTSRFARSPGSSRRPRRSRSASRPTAR